MKKPNIEDFKIHFKEGGFQVNIIDYNNALVKYTDHLESVNADLVEALEETLSDLKHEMDNLMAYYKFPYELRQTKINENTTVIKAKQALKKSKA